MNNTRPVFLFWNPLGTLLKRAVREGKTAMFLSKSHNQTILEISQGDYIAIPAESFRIDRQSEAFPHALKLQALPQAVYRPLRRKYSQVNKGVLLTKHNPHLIRPWIGLRFSQAFNL